MGKAAPSGAASVRWVETIRWLIRAVAVGAAALFLTSLNPLGVILSPEWLDHASLVALIAIPLALVLDVVAPPTRRRLWPMLRLLIGLPAALIALMWIALASGLPGVVNRVTTPGGQQYLLGVGPMPTDVDYQLWRSVGPGGVLWERAESLTWSEDGGFTRNPRLVLVAERWLMVRRGGIWTDCYELTPGGLRSCGGGHEVHDWRNPDAWRAASAEMAAKVGVRPEDA
ncbi:MAG: hypothetical protein KJ690_06530 [Alphaproteobacteria bacterium]|nr:hypothetical protein [Alphaproteobacteria bacterium]